MNAHIYVRLLVISLIGCILGGLAVASIQQTLAANPFENSLKLQLQYLDGIPITNFDWGTFRIGELKQLDCQIAVIGNGAARVVWDATDFPLDWKIEIREFSTPISNLWQNNSALTITSEKPLQIRIFLEEEFARPNQQYSFVLEFLSLETGQRARLG
jgi:hypothetical protein